MLDQHAGFREECGRTHHRILPLADAVSVEDDALRRLVAVLAVEVAQTLGDHGLRPEMVNALITHGDGS